MGLGCDLCNASISNKTYCDVFSKHSCRPDQIFDREFFSASLEQNSLISGVANDSVIFVLRNKASRGGGYPQNVASENPTEAQGGCNPHGTDMCCVLDLQLRGGVIANSYVKETSTVVSLVTSARLAPPWSLPGVVCLDAVSHCYSALRPLHT